MEVGQTSCGQTTLLNSFVNHLLGIKIEEVFKYTIIHENLEHHNQCFKLLKLLFIILKE